MTDLPDIPTIETAVFAILRDVIGDVLTGAGLAICRGPVGIGKSFALRRAIAECEKAGALVTSITAAGSCQGKIAEFLRALHGREGVSSAEGLELAFGMLAGYPFRPYGQKSVLIVDEAQDLAAPIIGQLRGLWDRGDLARLGDEWCPAFGIVMVGNDQFLSNGTRKERVDLLPLWDRITHNIRLPRPSAAEHAAHAGALFPGDSAEVKDLRAMVQAFGEDRGSLRAAAKAARQAKIRAEQDGKPVTADHLAFVIRMMVGQS
ncbi:ATP-binding protein [Palleronia caenipelagi]|uniref:ATP-binding protein n=1 Tax=Palleronia caenipelagi TaxID=2489174 RepID=A0A547Q830_9RHOB|nr:ATP-binding protein [Palleronia caenipelagi]TRD22540.1 ATP-binding protein [Palleronia caenipelagi]